MQASYDYFRRQLQALQPIHIEDAASIAHTTRHAEEPLAELRDLINKKDRVSFKLFQEVLDKLEDLSEQNTSSGEAMEAERKQFRSALDRLTKQLLELFDLLDLVRSNAFQQGDVSWNRNLEATVAKALSLLSDCGIEEIPAEQQLFDPSVMEGIGSISAQEIRLDLPRYYVHTVNQRGFRFAQTGELIRKAKVITVL